MILKSLIYLVSFLMVGIPSLALGTDSTGVSPVNVIQTTARGYVLKSGSVGFSGGNVTNLTFRIYTNGVQCAPGLNAHVMLSPAQVTSWPSNITNPKSSIHQVQLYVLKDLNSDAPDFTNSAHWSPSINGYEVYVKNQVDSNPRDQGSNVQGANWTLYCIP